MKLKFVILSAALLLSTSVVAFSQSIKASGFHNGYTYSYEIDDDTVKNTPSWNPEKEDAPLSFRKAIDIARANLKRFAPKADDKWEVYKVQLQRIGTNFPVRKNDKWIYEVEFYCFLGKCDVNDSFTFYVKLDGTIVEPEVTSDEKQK
jgi:hypothetical protein